MDEMDKRKVIQQYIKEISHYSQMQVFATSVYQKKYLQFQIDEASDELTDFFLISSEADLQQQQMQPAKQPEQPEQQQPLQQPLPPSNQQVTGELVITMEELAQNDGSGAKPAYVAVDGVVYDLSKVTQWGGGTHFGLYAGKDLTNEFAGCHKSMFEILQNVPKIGKLKKD